MEPILVELDAFSGRPNPQWLLTEEQGRGLLDLLSSLPSAASLPAPAPGLGYRGFKVRGIPGEGDVLVRDGAILATEAGLPGCRLDEPRAIEAFLLETARGHIDDVLLQTMASVIGL